MSDPNATKFRFGGAWAKAEIFLGLTAIGLALFGADWLLSQPTAEINWEWVACALALFVLGSYLTLAGQRSHIYRSNIELETRLVQRLSPRMIEGEPQ